MLRRRTCDEAGYLRGGDGVRTGVERTWGMSGRGAIVAAGDGSAP